MIMAGMVALALVALGGSKPAPVPTPPAPGEDCWRMTLAEAIRLGVTNSEVVRVVEGPKGDRGAMTIAQTNPDAEECRFRAAMMAHVRSIEQQYWALSYLNTEVWARETAVKLCQETIQQEKDDLACHRAAADVAEAQQCLDRCNLALVKATSDLVTAERQLRTLLGLPAADRRRIVPVTPATEAKLEPKWDDCLAAMQAGQPDLVMQRELVAEADARGDVVRSAKEKLAAIGRPASGAVAVPAIVEAERQAKAEADRRRESLKKATHEATHTLARSFLEVDASFKQFQVARRDCRKAKERLDEARKAHANGRTGLAIDTLLDAVVAYADAVAEESRFKGSYNTAIAALDEAKGTLLAECRIVVKSGPGPRTVPAGDADVKPAVATTTAPASSKPKSKEVGVRMVVTPRLSKDPKTGTFHLDFAVKRAGLQAPESATPVPAPDAPKPAPSSGRSIRYDVRLEGGPVPVRFQGSVELGAPAGAP